MYIINEKIILGIICQSGNGLSSHFLHLVCIQLSNQAFDCKAFELEWKTPLFNLGFKNITEMFDRHHPYSGPVLTLIFHIFVLNDILITEREKQIIIQEMTPYEPHDIGVFDNNDHAISLLYSLKKPCGLKFMDCWGALEDKLQKQVRFVEIRSLSAARPFEKKHILKSNEMFYSNGIPIQRLDRSESYRR